MQGTRTVLASGFLTLALITGSSAPSAAGECLAKPNRPTPQGQHWHYRIDHANDGRQCWYLRAETGRGQKNPRQAETDATQAMAQTVEAPQRAAAPVVDTPEQNAIPVAASIPWLNVQKLPDPIPFAQSAAQQKTAAQTATTGSAAPERWIDLPTAVPNRPAPSTDSKVTSAHRTREQQHRRSAQGRPEPLAPAIAHIDHTFALLMIMFAALAIAGPALHFVERRRRRKAVIFRPPSWARVVALNAPASRIRAMPRPLVAKPPAPCRSDRLIRLKGWRMRCNSSWTVCRQPSGLSRKRSRPGRAGAYRCETLAG